MVRVNREYKQPPHNAWRLRTKAFVSRSKGTTPVFLDGGPFAGARQHWSKDILEPLPIKSGKVTVGVYRVVGLSEDDRPRGAGKARVAQWVRIK